MHSGQGGAGRQNRPLSDHGTPPTCARTWGCRELWVSGAGSGVQQSSVFGLTTWRL